MPSRRSSNPQPPTKFAHLDPLHVIRKAREAGITEVAVSFSGGRDSLAVLDLCKKHFATVYAYWMYVVPGLEFQEKYLRYIERRYSLDILRIPHWMLANMFRRGVLRHPTNASMSLRRTRIRHVDAYVRKQFGCDGLYIASGEKYSDSLERNTQIVQCGGLSTVRHRLYPIGFWTHYDVQSYVARQNIVMPPDYRLRPQVSSRRRGQFGSLLTFDEIIPIRDNFPDDYQRICKYFPQLPAQMARYESQDFRQMIQDRESAAEAARANAHVIRSQKRAERLANRNKRGADGEDQTS